MILLEISVTVEVLNVLFLDLNKYQNNAYKNYCIHFLRRLRSHNNV